VTGGSSWEKQLLHTGFDWIMATLSSVSQAQRGGVATSGGQFGLFVSAKRVFSVIGMDSGTGLLELN